MESTSNKSVSNVNLRFFSVDARPGFEVIDVAVPHALENYVASRYDLDPDDDDDFDRIADWCEKIEKRMYTLDEIMRRMAKSETGHEAFTI